MGCRVKSLGLMCAALALQGCAVVVVQTAGERPRLSAWPFGVRVGRGANEAVSIDSKTVGLIAGCGMLGVGLPALRPNPHRRAHLRRRRDRET